MASTSARPRVTATRHAIAVSPPPSTTTCHNASPAPPSVPAREPVPPTQVVWPRARPRDEWTATVRQCRAPQTDGCRRRLAASAHGDRLAVDVDEIGRERWIEDACRRRPGHRARPRRRCGRLGARTEGRLLAPRHPAHPFGGRPSADGHRGDHRLRPEHPLHPCERPRRVVGSRGITAPEPELTTGRGHDLVGHQTEQGDAHRSR